MLLTSPMLRGEAKVWWKSIKGGIITRPVATIWEDFKKQFERKFVPEHVKQQKEAEFLNLKQGQMTVAVYVHTFLQLSKYATDLVDTEEKKVKRFLNGLNPSYKKMVMAGLKPTLFDDAVDKAYTAEEVHREKMGVNSAKRSESS